MNFFNKAKNFISYCFKTQPVVTTFAVTFTPLYGIFIYPEKLRLKQKSYKIEKLKKLSAEYDEKWDDINHYTRELLDEQRRDLDALKLLGIETFGEDVSLSGETPQHDTSTETVE